MFIVRIISKDGKKLSNEEVDNIMENNNPMLIFENIEQYEEFQPETEDKISFDFNSGMHKYNKTR